MSMGIQFWHREVEEGGVRGVEIDRGVLVVINKARDTEEKVEDGRRDIVGIMGGIMRRWRLGGRVIFGDLSGILVI